MTGLSRFKAAQTCAAFFIAAALLSGCAGPDSFGGSRRAVEEWGQPRGFAPLALSSLGMPLLALGRGDSDEELHVYIEGDGAAWPTSFHPPRDPTPDKPVALALAALAPTRAVVYLGRPCQYLDVAALATCSPKYWTSHRFSPDVMEAYLNVLDALKTRHGAQRLRLIGYSGGGVLAMLLAAKRDDVVQVITVASPVSVAEWASWHKVSPLDGSLDPATHAGKFPPALHFVGGSDPIVPVEVVAPFAKRSGGQIRLVPDFDHECCWSRDWRRLLDETR